MKNLLKKLTAVIILTLLTLLISSCQSNKKQIEYKVVYQLPDLYFPKFPKPGKNVLPYDKDFKKVTDVDTPIEYVVMPFWYYERICDYKLAVDEQAAKYEAFSAKYKPP